MDNGIHNLIIGIKNSYRAGSASATVTNSRFNREVLKVLQKENYIVGFSIAQDNRTLIVSLRYENDQPVMTSVKLISRPGRRIYRQVREIVPVVNGTGIAVVSTSKGIMTDRQARKAALGGEVLFEVW